MPTGIFDKLLFKENYSKEEVEVILSGTYEGFAKGYDKIIQLTEKKLLDKIKDMQQEHNHRVDESEFHEGYDTCFWDIINNLKK